MTNMIISNNTISYDSSNNDRIGSFSYTYNYENTFANIIETIEDRSDIMRFIAFLKGKFRT